MESKYGLALPVFADPDLKHGTDLTVWIQQTREKAAEGKVPLEMLSGATASIFDLSHTHINSAIPLLLPSHTTALSVGAPHASFGQSQITLTVDLRYCDALEAAALLDQLINSL
jgi:pyruvate/2-oxoglutarate dehydrogenase complex dihydrolipoamide acyltransferase (E2) component